MSKHSEVATEVHLYTKTFQTHGFDLNLAFFQNAPDELLPLLKSKSSGSGVGRPEMIFPLESKGWLVLEVKNDIALHSSVAGGFPIGDVSARIKAKDYAEDGVVCYMQGLATECDVIGLAISGQPNGDHLISTFRVKQGGKVEKLKYNKVLQLEQYWELLEELYSPKETPLEIKEFGDWLHNFLRDRMKLSEADKPMLVSGILVALQDDYFPKQCAIYNDDDLPEETLAAIGRVLDERTARTKSKSRGKVQKRNVMFDCFKSVLSKGATKTELRRVITEIRRNLHDSDHHKTSFDLLGHFYGEFLKYSGGDKKGLGIVLTPNHVTSLFARLAELKYGDAVLDTCTGTAGFLIAAMANLMHAYEHDEQKQNAIRKDALLGIEFNENNYTLACANMLLRGDGKSNIHLGSCFDKKFDSISSPEFGKPRVTMLNPPYNQKDENEHELDFIYRACELTKQGGKVIAIVPMSSVCEQSDAVVAKRAKLLQKNTLTAVMSMPDGIFPKVGAVTCVMVFTAGTPHQDEDTTWFAYWKDDGFKLKKGVRYELQPWWDCEQKKPAEIENLKDQSLKERLQAADGWVYPAHTWQVLEKPEGQKTHPWTASARNKNGVKVVEGTETHWFHDFRDRTERPQYAVKVRLFAKAEELQKEAIQDDSAALIAKGMEAKLAKTKAISNNQFWTPAFLEWCAEAYLETDYSQLTNAMFENALKEYAIFKLRNSNAT